MFVGRLLTEIYSPSLPNVYETLDQVFFVTQYTTALLYDPLLPLFRRAERDPGIKAAMGQVMGEFFEWATGRPFKIQEYRYEIAEIISALLEKHGLLKLQEQSVEAGLVRPETLLFTAFGVPSHVRLEYGLEKTT